MNIQIYALFFSIITFIVQLILFRKSSHVICHFIPLMCIGCIYLVSLGLFVSEINQSGGVLMNTLYSFILTGVNTTALIADGCAWLIEKV